MSLVVDASVAVKWFVEEVRSDIARVVLDSGEPLIAPDLIVAEVCNTAWKKVRRGEIPLEQGAAIVNSIPLSFDRIFGGPDLAPRAFALATRCDHPVYDCFYLALAEAESAQVVTDDDRVLRAARRGGVAHLAKPLITFRRRFRRRPRRTR